MLTWHRTVDDLRAGPFPGIAADPSAPRLTLRSIRHGLIVLNLLVVALCAAVLCRGWLMDVEDAKRRMVAAASMLERSITYSIDKVGIALNGAAVQVQRLPAARDGEALPLRAILRWAARQAPEIKDIAVFDAQGRPVCDEGDADCPRLDIHDRDYFTHLKAHPSDSPRLFGPVRSRLDGRPSLILARSRAAGNDTFNGVIIAVMPLEALKPLLVATRIGPRGSASLRTAAMAPVLRVPELDAFKDGPALALSDTLQRALVASPDSGVYRAVTMNDGVDRVTAYRKLDAYPLYVLVGNATQDFLDGWYAHAGSAAAFLLLFAAASLVIDRVAAVKLGEQERVRRLHDEAPCAYHTLDAQGRYRSINATELRWLGCTRDEVIGKLGPADFLSERDRRAFRGHFDRLLNEGAIDGLELELMGRQGDVRHVLVNATRVLDQDGRFVMSNTVMHDVTDLHVAREELAAHAAEQHAMLDNDMVGIVRVRQGMIVWKNRGMDRMFGYQGNEWAGMHASVLYPDEEAFRRLATAVCRKTSADGPLRQVTELRRKDGTRLWVDGARVKLGGPDSDTLSILHDITDLKRSEALRIRAAELEAENRSLQASNRLKDEFVSNMSHELRTPLNAVIGLAYLLQRPGSELDASRRERYLKQIGDSARQVLALIENVLDIAKNQAGRIEFDVSPVDVRAALDEVADMLRAQGREGLIRVSVDDALQTVHADPLRLRQMVLNLGSNAVKFSPPGGTIDIRARALDPERWCIEVEDRGIGISPEDAGRLFNAFVQLDAGRMREHGGAGLGLLLVRLIAQAQGGDVAVRSEPGKGSVFTLTLPRRLTAPGAGHAS